jgi:hypothetical protein
MFTRCDKWCVVELLANLTSKGGFDGGEGFQWCFEPICRVCNLVGSIFGCFAIHSAKGKLRVRLYIRCLSQSQCPRRRLRCAQVVCQGFPAK